MARARTDERIICRVGTTCVVASHTITRHVSDLSTASHVAEGNQIGPIAGAVVVHGVIDYVHSIAVREMSSVGISHYLNFFFNSCETKILV